MNTDSCISIPLCYRSLLLSHSLSLSGLKLWILVFIFCAAVGAQASFLISPQRTRFKMLWFLHCEQFGLQDWPCQIINTNASAGPEHVAAFWSTGRRGGCMAWTSPDHSQARRQWLNVETVRGRRADTLETLTRRGTHFVCIQEHRWSCASVRKTMGKDVVHTFFWVGNSD